MSQAGCYNYSPEFSGKYYICEINHAHSGPHKAESVKAEWDASGWIVRDGERVREPEDPVVCQSSIGRYKCILRNGHVSSHRSISGALWSDKDAESSRKVATEAVPEYYLSSTKDAAKDTAADQSRYRFFYSLYSSAGQYMSVANQREMEAILRAWGAELGNNR